VRSPSDTFADAFRPNTFGGEDAAAILAAPAVTLAGDLAVRVEGPGAAPGRPGGRGRTAGPERDAEMSLWGSS
jgi:hypothetical protein